MYVLVSRVKLILDGRSAMANGGGGIAWSVLVTLLPQEPGD